MVGCEGCGLPLEVWATVFSFLDGEALWRCGQVCRSWSRELERIVRRGGLGARHLTCSRLTYQPGDDALEHRKAVRTCLSVRVSHPVILQGVSTYTGEDSNILDLSVPVVFDRGTTNLTVYRGEEVLASKVEVTTTAEARAAILFPSHIPHNSHTRL